SFALSEQAMPAFIFNTFYCAGRTCEDNSNEVEPRPNSAIGLFSLFHSVHSVHSVHYPSFGERIDC
ncbi:MAG: hypothetical protein LBG80_15020, partial [Bacteroidales bacterium]|nr:hypothetical protein [Bacteroidales bacterium]